MNELTLVQRRRGQSSDLGRAALQRDQAALLGAGRGPVARRCGALRAFRRRLSGARQRLDFDFGAGRRRRPRRDRLFRGASGFAGRAAFAHPGGHARGADADRQVEIGYVGYVAHTDPCGDWSKDLAETASNQSRAEFRLRRAAQHRRHGRRPARSGDSRGRRRPATRRGATTVLGNYEKGKVTSADKNAGPVGQSVRRDQPVRTRATWTRRSMRITRQAFGAARARASRAAHFHPCLLRVPRHRRGSAARRRRPPSRQGQSERRSSAASPRRSSTYDGQVTPNLLIVETRLSGRAGPATNSTVWPKSAIRRPRWW